MFCSTYTWKSLPCHINNCGGTGKGMKRKRERVWEKEKSERERESDGARPQNYRHLSSYTQLHLKNFGWLFICILYIFILWGRETREREREAANCYPQKISYHHLSSLSHQCNGLPTVKTINLHGSIMFSLESFLHFVTLTIMSYTCSMEQFGIGHKTHRGSSHYPISYIHNTYI